MSVPFVGKDVPSRSSEFAHPDVVIGLTIMAYRYEGLRISDMRRLMSQLKSDFSRQGGPRDLRPASRLFHSWISKSMKEGNETMIGNKRALSSHMHRWDHDTLSGNNLSRDNLSRDGLSRENSSGSLNMSPPNSPLAKSKSSTANFNTGMPVSPLPLFQPNDPLQLSHLFQLTNYLTGPGLGLCGR